MTQYFFKKKSQNVSKRLVFQWNQWRPILLLYRNQWKDLKSYWTAFYMILTLTFKQISFKDSKLPQIYQKEHQCFSFSIDLRHQPFSYIYLILLKKSTKNVRIGHFVMKLRLLLKLSVLKIVLCNKKDVWNFCLFLCIVYQTTYVWLPGG